MASMSSDNHGQTQNNRGCVVLETERDKKNINMTRAYPKNTDIYIYNTSWRAPTSPCSREPYRSLALTPRTHGTCKERWLAWMTHKHKLLLSSSAAPALTCLLVGGRGCVWLRSSWKNNKDKDAADEYVGYLKRVIRKHGVSVSDAASPRQHCCNYIFGMLSRGNIGVTYW